MSTTASNIDARRFTANAARLGPLLPGLILALAVESMVLHVVLVSRHPAVAWALLVVNVWTVIWLWREDRAVGSAATELTTTELRVRFGNSFSGVVPLDSIESVSAAGWRDLGHREPKYLKAYFTAGPNVLLRLRRDIPFRGPFGYVKSVKTVGFRLDDPAGFISALSATTSVASSPVPRNAGSVAHA